MEDRDVLEERIAALEKRTAELQDVLAAAQQEVTTAQEALAAAQQQLAERDARIAELEAELRRRGKGYRPKPNRQRKARAVDRRTQGERKHGGFFRQPPQPREEEIQHHDVVPEQCPSCGSTQLEPTGQYDDHLVVDIPEPRLEYHRYRRHEMECQTCGQRCQGRGERELPGSHVGPRARLLACYARGYLGISLEKSCQMLSDLWGLGLSRAGALGHLKWGGKLFAPIVQEFLKRLRQAPVVHADETGWRINGKNVWAWCFSNPQLAVFLIHQRRSSQVLIEALGASLPGVLVSDFYAAYNCLDATKQRCLTHLLRELHELRETLPPRYVSEHIQPLITLFQDAIALAKRRAEMPPADYDAASDAIYVRFGDCVTRQSRHPDVQRIYARLHKHVDELFTFLERPEVPADNNLGERDIRSLAAARSDGGVNRADWSATAFGHIKSVIRTCQKNARNFFQYGLDLVAATLHRQPPPLPLVNSS